MAIENLRLGHSPLSDRVFAGYLGKDGVTWRQKKDITNDFIGAVLGRWNGYKETITTSDGDKYEITVKKLE